MKDADSNHCDYAGLSNLFMNLLIIGDPHAHPDYDNKRFTALGKYIAKEKPDVIVCIGEYGRYAKPVVLRQRNEGV